MGPTLSWASQYMYLRCNPDTLHRQHHPLFKLIWQRRRQQWYQPQEYRCASACIVTFLARIEFLGNRRKNISFHQNWCGDHFQRFQKVLTPPDRHKDRNNIPDRFGYRPIQLYFSKHFKTLISMFGELSIAAVELQNLRFDPQLRQLTCKMLL